VAVGSSAAIRLQPAKPAHSSTMPISLEDLLAMSPQS